MTDTLFPELPARWRRAYESRIDDNVTRHGMVHPAAVAEARTWVRAEMERDARRREAAAAQLPLFSGGGNAA